MSGLVNLLALIRGSRMNNLRKAWPGFFSYVLARNQQQPSSEPIVNVRLSRLHPEVFICPNLPGLSIPWLLWVGQL